MLSTSPWLVETVRRTLLAEGFRNAGLFQIWKKGQVYGYIRRLGDNVEWHVRAFVDGTLESEIEPPRTTIRHLLERPYFSDGLLAQLLQRHRIPFHNGLDRIPWQMALRLP